MTELDKRTIVDVKIKKAGPDVKIPVYSTLGAGAADIYIYPRYSEEFPEKDGFANFEHKNTIHSVIIKPRGRMRFRTGLHMEIPNGYTGFIFPRSGISNIRHLNLMDCVGVIDSDFRGEITLTLNNNSDDFKEIQPWERIAQILILKTPQMVFEVVDELSETERGNKGFGSTGLL